MIKILLLIPTLLLLMLPVSLSALERYQMELQGSGTVKYMGFIRVYDAYLYTAPSTLPGEVLSADSSRCLKLNYAVELTRENFIEAAETILKRQHDAKTLRQVQPQLDLLHNSYQGVKTGDSYTLCYNSEIQTTSLILNGIEQVQIPSADFAEVYFGIWLGEKAPLSKSLRTALLSGLNGVKS